MHEQEGQGKDRKMKEDHFRSLEPLVELADHTITGIFKSQQLDKLKRLMQEVSAKLPPEDQVSLNIELSVFSPERQGSLPLVRGVLCAAEKVEPYLTHSDSTVHRYIVDGDVCQVPHDYCPHCWGEWDFKFMHPECEHCGYKLGKEVKVLLDSDMCPHCEKGKVSMESPGCGECGFIIEPDFVAWG